MPRGSKPELQIYTRGSGPLRKSDRGTEENDTDSNLKYTKNSAASRLDRIKNEESRRVDDIESSSSKFADLNISERRKQKKPEQQLYVPKVVAKARENNYRQEGNKNEKNGNGNNNQNVNDRNMPNRSKRYSTRRRNNETGDVKDEWRGPSPTRNYRQGSEPRGSYQQNGGGTWNRGRDTRSVEPVNSTNRNYNSEKSHLKPPSGRRHSTIGVESDKRKIPTNMDNIPPRFRKKYLDENKVNIFKNQNDDSWDGSSITFQGNTQQYYQKPSYDHMSNQHITSNNMVYCTLPNRRGRGRLQQEAHNPPMYRSMTPDKMYVHSPMNSRPGTPTNFGNKTRSNEQLSRGDSRSHTPVNFFRNDDRNRISRVSEERYSDDQSNGNNSPRKEKFTEDRKPKTAFRESLENQLSPVSPPTPEEKKLHMDLVSLNTEILDWSEEVELHSKNLEAEALSDALTRSSSMASLMETSTKSLPSNPRQRNRKRKGKKNKRSGSSNRDRSLDKPIDDYHHPNIQETHRLRQNLHTSMDSSARDNFKIPDSRPHHRRPAKDNRDKSFDRRNRSRNASRERSFDRTQRGSCSEYENQNWRSRNNTVEREIVQKKNLDRESIEKDMETKTGGIIHLPQQTNEPPKNFISNVMTERPKLPDMSRKSMGQKTLYDPNNPNTPIIINTTNSRGNCPGFSENSEQAPPQLGATDQYGNVRPVWYNESADDWKQSRNQPLLRDIKKADIELQNIISSGYVLQQWERVSDYRNFLKESLKYLLCYDLKLSQKDNVENHFWKILYYNIIEIMRKSIMNDPSNKEQYKVFLLEFILEGTEYYESLLEILETIFKFKITDYIGSNSHNKPTGFVNLALVSAQKIYICLGDLARYKEQANETSSYGKCRQLYVKAHEINPKNGRPYNQLAVLAFYSRKKLDAVYFYMRSLMSTNPVQSARESLISLFDENRKKYEHSERKRREERLEKARQHMKEKESQDPKYKRGSLRKETWIRPDGGRRVHRTTSTLQEQTNVDSEEEDLAALSSVEVNKRFVTSYLHVHGKLITNIGMETFHETALQMLKEFRALLQHSPVPLPSTRFLQLLALNMFAIDSTQLKDAQLQSGYRSEPQERALIVSLQMFSLILEKCISLLSEHINSNPDNINAIPQDAHELLPSVKIWCDWMLCHSSIWNPPPSTQDFKVGPTGDAWSRLASLMNLLEKLDQSISSSFVQDARDGYEQVRLPEDGALSGFKPLMLNEQESTYVPKDTDMEAAQFALRIYKLLFFGTVFLCGLEPPVLKLEFQKDFMEYEYVSVVCTTANRSTPNTPPEFDESELLLESFSDEGEGGDEPAKPLENASVEIQELLTRKVELEKRQRDQELHSQTVRKILRQSVVSVHIEVKPKNLVPDTNCFIDYLEMLKTIASSNVYTLMVPLIVLNELEGLAKGSKSPLNSPRSSSDPAHVVKVAEASKIALEFLNTKHNGVKCITTKGTILTSTTFTKEGDTLVDVNMTNDDRILATCMTLCRGPTEQVIGDVVVCEGEPRKLRRDIVLLTEDRNLRVKALARDVPVREVPSFLQWAGLG